MAALDQIMGASGLMATGIVSNTHLCDQTDVSHVIDGFILCREFSERVGLPVEFVGVPLWLEREPDIRAHGGHAHIVAGTSAQETLGSRRTRWMTEERI